MRRVLLAGIVILALMAAVGLVLLKLHTQPTVTSPPEPLVIENLQPVEMRITVERTGASGGLERHPQDPEIVLGPIYVATVTVSRAESPETVVRTLEGIGREIRGSLGVIQPGTYDFEIALHARSGRERNSAFRRVATKTVEGWPVTEKARSVVATIAYGSLLRISVKSPDGAALTDGVRVFLSPHKEDAFRERGDASIDSGMLVLRGLDAGPYDMRVAHPAYGEIMTDGPVHVWEDSTTTVELTFPETKATLRGVVTDADGKPLHNATVWLRTDSDEQNGRRWPPVVYTDAKGAFSVGGLEQGIDYQARFRLGGYEEERRVLCFGQLDNTLRIELRTKSAAADLAGTHDSI